MSFIQKTEQYFLHRQTSGQFEVADRLQDHKWIYDKNDFKYLMSHYQDESSAVAILAQMGGVEGIAFSLRTSTTTGISEDELINKDFCFNIRKEKYGKNELSLRPPVPFYVLCLDELGDPMLRVLVVAGLLSMGIGAIQDLHHGWVDGLAVLFAVLVVVLVGSVNNYKKEKQFRIMEEEAKKKYTIVLRNGEEEEIPFSDIVVGDLIILRNGFTIPCDGIFVLGTENLKADQSGLTGETREITKNLIHDPLLMSGTNIVQGEGLMIAITVGDDTEWGQLMNKLQEERDETPLQQKLEILGRQIGWGGTLVAILLFLILLIKWLISDDKAGGAQKILNFFITAITIVVVAVPEGLPLAVTISLAYSMKKMLSDNNFVRHLSACETMGNATTICSDKTGTLTQNKMSVTSLYLCNKYYKEFNELPKQLDLNIKVSDKVIIGVCINSKAFQQTNNEHGKPKLIGGNQTECALLQWVIDMGATDYKNIRSSNPIIKWFPFDSSVKRSSVITKYYKSNIDNIQVINDDNTSNEYIIYSKGAAEQLLDICDKFLDHDGNESILTIEIKSNILLHMNKMTSRGLRCLGIGYKIINKNDIPFVNGSDTIINDNECNILFKNMVWISICGIQDPVRQEVPHAVKTCQKAGIVVRMITGDHLDTAKHIAKECGILTNSSQVCMEGKDFRVLNDNDKLKLLPNLRVLARSKPSDKELIVSWYKKVNNDIVAVTGDGANDALALKDADVGLSMGIQGTDVAKEASDIIILDDNFASIEKTVMWGRSVFDNIRKFVQFQLTVNVVALTISLVSAFFDKFQNPLTPVQLLWVNLIMDTMAALALATEKPTRSLLERFPYKKSAHLINSVLWRFILGHSAYQCIILFFTMFAAKDLLNVQDTPQNMRGKQNIVHLTIVFNTFVFLQIFNEINARKIGDIKVFKGIFDNYYIVSILLITILMQIIIVSFGGNFISTRPLNLIQWIYCVACGSGSLIANLIISLIPVNLNDGVLHVNSEELFHVDSQFIGSITQKITIQ